MRSHRNILLALTSLLTAAVLNGCGTSALGEDCSSVGKSEGCDDGLICDNDAGKSVCLKICTVDADCPATQACTAVTGVVTKACHTR